MALVANLILWLIGLASGGSFEMTDQGKVASVAPGGVITLTVVPLLVGLSLAMLISLKWEPIIRIAQVVGAVFALGTIALTIAADFDARQHGHARADARGCRRERGRRARGRTSVSVELDRGRRRGIRLDDLGCHVTQLGVRGLRLPAQHVKCGVGGDPMDGHQHAFGLFYRRPSLEPRCRRQLPPWQI